MPLVLVKVIDFLVEPLGVGLFTVRLGLGISTRHRSAGYTLAGIGVLWLWVLATPWMGEALLGSRARENGSSA